MRNLVITVIGLPALRGVRSQKLKSSSRRNRDTKRAKRKIMTQNWRPQSYSHLTLLALFIFIQRIFRNSVLLFSYQIYGNKCQLKKLFILYQHSKLGCRYAPQTEVLGVFVYPYKPAAKSDNQSSLLSAGGCPYTSRRHVSRVGNHSYCTEISPAYRNLKKLRKLLFGPLLR